MTGRLATCLLLSAALLAAGTAVAAERQEATGRYLVKYRDAPAGRALREARHPERVLRRLERHGAAALRLTPAEAAALAADPAVELVEPDPLRSPVPIRASGATGADIPAPAGSGSTQTVPYGVAMVQARGYRGVHDAGIRTCVVDSGYDLGHEDLPLRLRVSGSDDPGGTGSWREDGDGHGTHVSGTINARNNTVGVLGVFPGAPLHIVRVFGDQGGWAYSSDLVAALDACEAAGARVVSMSLGGGAPSAIEKAAFAAANTRGVLSFAAAGNNGNTSLSYPASYPSVVSVAAVDQNAVRAPFSNRNSRVGLAAPGVGVLSTVPRGSFVAAALQSALGRVEAVPMDNFSVPSQPVTGALADCGLAGTPEDCAAAAGALCLIERGTFTFAEKAQNCEAAGGIGAIVFNRGGEPGPVYGTLGETRVGIPVIGIDRATGVGLREAHLGSSATIDFSGTLADYDYYSGTSMATPHVSAVAALVWSRHPRCTNADVRRALVRTAVDLGAPGRDVEYGYGLVQARAAGDFLGRQACAAP